MPISTSIRQAPSPTAQSPGALSAQSQPNGLANGLLPNGMPQAGQQTDINYLWQIVQELSDALAANRAQTAGIVEQVRLMRLREREQGREPSDGNASQSREPEEGQEPRVNGNTNHTRDTSGDSEAMIQIAELRSQLHNANSRNQTLTEELGTQTSLNDDYVAFLNSIMEKLRTYAHAHSQATIGIHAHYNKLLEEERETNLQLRIEHGEWQAGLGKAAEWARKALKERVDETNGMERKMREVRAENRVLRRLLGWDPGPEESDEETEEMGRATSEVGSGVGAIKRRSGLRAAPRGPAPIFAGNILLEGERRSDEGGGGDGGDAGPPIGGGGQGV